MLMSHSHVTFVAKHSKVPCRCWHTALEGGRVARTAGDAQHEQRGRRRRLGSAQRSRKSEHGEGEAQGREHAAVRHRRPCARLASHPAAHRAPPAPARSTAPDQSPLLPPLTRENDASYRLPVFTCKCLTLFIDNNKRKSGLIWGVTPLYPWWSLGRGLVRVYVLSI